MTGHYWAETGGFACEATGKSTDFVWTDHSKPGNGNSCEHCTGERKTLRGLLEAANDRRKAARRR